MAKRGTLYRCHLFSYAGPQTAGITSRWLYELEPTGDGAACSGDLVELHAIVESDQYRLRPDSKIRFDILEEDFLIGGGADDKIVTLLGTGAATDDEDFPIEQRETVFDVLTPGADCRDYVRRYREEHADTFQRALLVLEEPYATDAEAEAHDDAPRQYHVLTWWVTRYDSEIGDSEFYFILNADGEFDDQSERTLDVADRSAPEIDRVPGMWAVETAVRRINELLETGILHWSVTAAEARTVSGILNRLPPLVLLDTIMRLRLSGRWTRFARAMHDADLLALSDLERRIDPNLGYIVPGDVINLEIHLGSDPSPQQGSGMFDVRANGILVVPLRDSVNIVGLAPVDAANAIAQALFAIGMSAAVILKFERRGGLYAGSPSRLADPDRAFEHRSTWFPDPNDPRVQHQQRQRLYLSYIEGVSATDDHTVTALLHYMRWLEDHAEDPEFLTREPADLWSWALHEASAPPPSTPLTPFLALQRSVLNRLDQLPPDEKRRQVTALDRFGRWIDQHRNDADLAQRDPVAIWARIAADVAVQEVREQVQREAERRAAEPPPIDWDAVGRKLDAVMNLARARIWRVPEARVESGVIESGGIGGFFQERRGVSYLIMPSDLEHVVRGQIADQFLTSVYDRATSPDFLRTTAEEDFTDFLYHRGDLTQALTLAAQNPYVERSEFTPEIEDWQMAVEIGIGFIPIVGQVVGAVEVATGRSLFGRELGPVERGITAAAILLPAAGKIFGTGRRLVTAAQIARDYRLTMGEANALYRAAFRVRPGSVGARLLNAALPEIQAGRRITDRETIRAAAELLQEMGMTERATARALSLPSPGPMRGAELATVEELENVVATAVGDQQRAQRVLAGLSTETRDALRAAVRAEPDWLGRTVQRELEGTFNRYTDALVGRMEFHGMPKEQADLLRPAMASLNAERRAVLSGGSSAIATTRVAEMSSAPLLHSEGDLLLTELRRRQAAATAAGQASRAQALGRRIATTQNWLQGAGSTQAELDLLRQTVASSAHLTDLVATVGAQPTLRRLWIQYRLLAARRGGSLTFEEYVNILTRHFRGNFGEFEVAFRLGRTHILLKPPDSLVTLPGTDLIAIPRTGGDLLLIDNKALAATQVTEVSSLTRNLPRNLGMDLTEFSRLAGSPDVPVHMQLAINRMTRAQQQLQPIVRGLTREQIAAPAVQAQIDAVLRANNIQRVVTNAGGSVTGLSADLRAIGLDLRNLN